MITCNRTSLLAELALLAPVVRSERVIPLLTCVRLGTIDNHLQLVGSSADATLIAEMEAEGDLPPTCVVFNTLHAAVKLFDGDSVELAIKANKLEVSCGRSRHKLPTYDTTQYPDPSPVDGETTLFAAQPLLAAIQAVGPCVDKKDGRWATRGVNLEADGSELNVVAFDGTQMGVVRLGDNKSKFSATIIADALPALVKVLEGVEDVAVTVGTNALKFDTGPRVLLTRLLVGEFPKWRMIFPANATHSVTLTPEVATAVKRCAVTASEGNLVRRRLRLEFGHEVLTVRSYGGDGESVEEVAVGCATLNGEAMVVKVNADQLLAYLQTVESPTVTFTHEESILVFAEGERRYLHAALRKDK